MDRERKRNNRGVKERRRRDRERKNDWGEKVELLDGDDGGAPVRGVCNKVQKQSNNKQGAPRLFCRESGKKGKPRKKGRATRGRGSLVRQRQDRTVAENPNPPARASKGQEEELAGAFPYAGYRGALPCQRPVWGAADRLTVGSRLSQTLTYDLGIEQLTSIDDTNGDYETRARSGARDATRRPLLSRADAALAERAAQTSHSRAHGYVAGFGGRAAAMIPGAPGAAPDTSSATSRRRRLLLLLAASWRRRRYDYDRVFGPTTTRPLFPDRYPRASTKWPAAAGGLADVAYDTPETI
ncbi:hypothetical protein MRX96_026645 [Rhipicephalus microplus]